MISRRNLLIGLAVGIAAPAIVRASSLMAINADLVPGAHNFTLEAMLRARDMLRRNFNSGPLYLMVPDLLLEFAKEEFPGVIVQPLPFSVDYTQSLPLIVKGPAAYRKAA